MSPCLLLLLIVVLWLRGQVLVIIVLRPWGLLLWIIIPWPWGLLLLIIVSWPLLLLLIILLWSWLWLLPCLFCTSWGLVPWRVLVQLLGWQGDWNHWDIAACLHRQKTLLDGLPYIHYAYWTDDSILVQLRHSSLYNLCNGHRLVYCLSHSFKYNFTSIFLLKQRNGIADVVTNQTLSSDSDFILINGSISLRVLHFSVSIHERERER